MHGGGETTRVDTTLRCTEKMEVDLPTSPAKRLSEVIVTRLSRNHLARGLLRRLRWEVVSSINSLARSNSLSRIMNSENEMYLK